MDQSLRNIRLFTALFSLLLSFFAFYTDDIINRDGILYINMAQVYLSGGLAATSQLYDWPFFPILIAYIHQLTSLSLENSAQLLNLSFFVLLTDALVLISSKLLPSYRQVIISAIFILCFQSFNEYRDFIIRDAGYWAFSSLLLYRFIIYIENTTIKNATTWQIIAFLVILFRIEGVVLLLTIPLYLFAIRNIKQACWQIIQLNYLVIFSAIVAITTLLAQSDISSAFNKISTIQSYINFDRLFMLFDKKTVLLEAQILNRFSAEYSALILSSGLITMLLHKLITALPFGYTGLYLFNRWQQKHIQVTPYYSLIAYFTIINLVILLAFLFHSYFISTRYAVLALIGFLLLMLPRLCRCLEDAWKNKNKSLLFIIGILLTISLVDGLYSSRSKSYIKDTALWAAQNLPAESQILTPDKFIHYYMKSQNTDTTVTQNNIKTYLAYDYLIVVEKRKNTSLRQALSTMKLKVLYRLQDKRGNYATIYQVINLHLE